MSIEFAKPNPNGAAGAVSVKYHPAANGEVKATGAGCVSNAPIALVEIWAMNPDAAVKTLRAIANDIAAKAGGIVT